jgi:hypothetical protein
MTDKKALKLREIMEQAQVFASAWSLVGGRFDGGNAMDDAEVAKMALHQMIEEALAKQEQGEPVAWFREEKGEKIYYATKAWDDCLPLYTTPQRRPWVGLMRGVRVEGDTVVISVKGGNDAARELCGKLINEMNT